MQYLPGIFALCVAASGWYYLFYSKAASRLKVVEGQIPNTLRVTLRRVCAVMMILLAVAFYAGYYSVDPHGRAFALCWLAVVLLLGAIVFLALLDVLLTRSYWRSRNRTNKDQ